MHTYRKIEPIKAEQFDGSDKMIEKYQLVKNTIFEGDYALPRLYGPIIIVREGDWIITDSVGDFSKMSDKEFRQTYERYD